MAATSTPSQKKTAELRGKASLIGIDGAGDRHYVVAPTVADGRPVLVETGDGVEEIDLEDTPCVEQDDAIDAWIDHVERKRGAWEYIAYGRPTHELVAAAVEGQR